MNRKYKTKFQDKGFASLDARFTSYQEKLKESEFFRKSIEAIKEHSISSIRCLALGSPMESIPALYQLAYLKLIHENLGLSSDKISLYDPVFSKMDKELLESTLGFVVEDQYDKADADILYFLPHATLELTEELFLKNRPRLLLSNDIISHTDKLSSVKLHESFLNLSLARNLIEMDIPKSSNDGFSVVASKRSRKNRSNKGLAVEYNYDNSYFKKINIVQLQCINDCWGNSFSDLSFHSLE